MARVLVCWAPAEKPHAKQQPFLILIPTHVLWLNRSSSHCTLFHPSPSDDSTITHDSFFEHFNVLSALSFFSYTLLSCACRAIQQTCFATGELVPQAFTATLLFRAFSVITESY